MTTCENCGGPVEIGDFPLCRGNPADHKGGHGSMLIGNAARIDTVVYFKNSKGEVCLPGRNDEATPRGYERCETTQPSEVRGLLKRMDTESRIQHEMSQMRQEIAMNEQRTALRSELRRQMQSMSPRGRDFARLAIERTNNRARPRFEPGNHMVALEYNDSNHDAAMAKNGRNDHAVQQKEVFGGAGAGSGH